MDPRPPQKHHSSDIAALLWLRSVLLVTLFISALGALISFRCLLIYVGVTTGHFQLVEGTPEHELFQAIDKDPAPRLILEGFNLVLWLGVLIGATHLLRFREWARLFIKGLITVDLFVTLGVALWPALARRIYGKPVETGVTVDLFVTTIEVLIVLALSHPRIVSLTDIHRDQARELRRLTGVRERWPSQKD